MKSKQAIVTIFLAVLMLGATGCVIRDWWQDLGKDALIEHGIRIGRRIALEYEGEYKAIKQAILDTIQYIESEYVFVEPARMAGASEYILRAELEAQNLSPEKAGRIVAGIYGDEKVAPVVLEAEPERTVEFLKAVIRGMEEARE